MTFLDLTEFSPRRLDEEFLSKTLGTLIWKNYGKQIAVEFPSPKTDQQWVLCSQGWAGFIPLDAELGIMMQPKVELQNLFRMLEYAYRLKSFHFLDGLVPCQSLREFYERLAHVLARRILDRGRKGFHRAYLSRSEDLPFIRGRVDVTHSLRRPWAVETNCHYQDHTADIEDNQILAWTLSRIARSGMCTERVLPRVRHACRTLQGVALPLPVAPDACAGRLYDRLNQDYQPLHALCRFFLEQSGPSHELGDRQMLPFLVDMARLYELFVAEWLNTNLPHGLTLRAQERVGLGAHDRLHFDIDLVLYDTHTEDASHVLDTKYKRPQSPDTADIAQVVTYAKLKRCREAALVYPVQLERPVDEMVGDIRVRSLTFGLQGDLDEAGQRFCRDVGLR